MKINYYQTGILIGYKLFSNNKISAVPFISPNLRGYVPTRLEIQKNKDYIGYSIGPRTSYALGLNIDYAISSKTEMVLDKKVNSNWYVRFQAGYCYPTLYKSNELLTGSVLYFLIGITTTSNILKRDF